MEGSRFDEIGFFKAIAAAEVRALLIGRRALVVLGLPVLTADYDLWIHVDDAAGLNEAVEPFGLAPTRTLLEARETGRYSLQNDEVVNVLVARSVPTVDGRRVAFEEVWTRRQTIAIAPDAAISLPALDDLIATKRFANRPKDAEDIRLLETLRSRGEP